MKKRLRGLLRYFQKKNHKHRWKLQCPNSRTYQDYECLFQTNGDCITGQFWPYHQVSEIFPPSRKEVITSTNETQLWMVSTVTLWWEEFDLRFSLQLNCDSRMRKIIKTFPHCQSLVSKMVWKLYLNSTVCWEKNFSPQVWTELPGTRRQGASGRTQGRIPSTTLLQGLLGMIFVLLMTIIMVDST